MCPRCFEQNGRAIRIDREVGKGISGGPVMRRLSRSMYDEFDVCAVSGEDTVNCRRVAYIQIVMRVAPQLLFQFVRHPLCGSGRAKEYFAHTIVDSDHIKPERCEISSSFRSN